MRERPNILYVFTDEQAAATMAAYGNTQIEMPNLNRLAEQSVVFDKAYVTQAVCTPSRSTLLTGLYPHTNGCTENNVTLPADVPCLPELADWEGYAMGYHDKWHLGNEIFAQHGFTDFISIDDGYRPHYEEQYDKNAHSTYHDWLVANGFRPDARAKDGFESFSRGFCARLPEEYSKPFYVANEACRFIRENRDRPFLLAVNFFEPHMPYFGPRDDQYDPADIPLPANFHDVPTEANPLKTRLYHAGYYANGHSGLPLRTEDDWRRLIANYWGLCSLVDTQFGRVLDTLARCGLMEDTIIIYTSDHGDMMGSHRLLAKCTQFEEAATVPAGAHPRSRRRRPPRGRAGLSGGHRAHDPGGRRPGRARGVAGLLLGALPPWRRGSAPRGRRHLRVAGLQQRLWRRGRRRQHPAGVARHGHGGGNPGRLWRPSAHYRHAGGVEAQLEHHRRG